MVVDSQAGVFRYGLIGGNISWVFWFGKRASYDFSLYSVFCLESSLNAGHANCWHKTAGATGMAPLLR
ncbi:hypothetical protein C4K38_3826 [Pseudomonas chlororaphis subsp. piscium]|nr:hypothetical protein C4K38_3826 [Pseudomonas chlororaphis subsp. piscium]SDS82548.1 hypothetical protein SAMN05216585_3563 [Pseudomonas chlororaphis]